ncbi:AraC family transcriptional regulator [Burkholderia gladioli]|nr:AraC family transcriptional regulator [Burkholderia gladioli]
MAGARRRTWGFGEIRARVASRKASAPPTAKRKAAERPGGEGPDGANHVPRSPARNHLGPARTRRCATAATGAVHCATPAAFPAGGRRRDAPPASDAPRMDHTSPPAPRSSSQLHAHAAARQLDAALQSRRYPLAQGEAGLDRAALLLLSGRAEVAAGRQIHQLQAPALLWTPATPDDHLRLAPGSAGIVLAVSGELAREALGQNAESVQLRYLADRPTAIETIGSAEALGDLRHSFDALLREIRREERGSWNLLSAHLALILIQCWRLTGCEDLSQQGQGTGASLLLRFRHLVELHFRAHWTVEHYARQLGISADRLHDLCTRSLGRTPLALLHERVVHESRLRLVRSGLSIEQVADHLGFKSTTHFSRFFRRKTGLTPAGFRRQAQDGPDVAHDATRSYADWP